MLITINLFSFTAFALSTFVFLLSLVDLFRGKKYPGMGGVGYFPAVVMTLAAVTLFIDSCEPVMLPNGEVAPMIQVVGGLEGD